MFDVTQFVVGDDDDDDDEVCEQSSDKFPMTSVELCFINLMRTAIMALQLFPENCAGGK